MTERLCKDCKHCVLEGRFYNGDIVVDEGSECDIFGGMVSPVTGKDLPQHTRFQALFMRATMCGWRDPKFWEPRR